jgi:spermidine synthase
MLSVPFWLSFVIGFLSLSEEIVWVRTVGFAYETLPPAFSFVLVCYLLGIAVGAALGKRICASVGNLYAAAAVLLSAAALTDVLTPPVVGLFMSRVDTDLGVAAGMMVVTAGLKSALFPIVHHLGTVADRTHLGRSMSRIYFGNIMGATLGPILTGFVALDHLNVDECFGLAGAVCLLASVVCVLKSAKPLLLLATMAAAALSSFVSYHYLLPGPGVLGAFAVGNSALNHFIANRHGVVHTVVTTQGQFVFGGNVYDGIAAVNVDNNQNRLDRVYMAALAHPDSRNMLFIGLSTGAWVRAIEGVPGVESIDVIEINPAYIKLIQEYPKLAPLLSDPRVHLHIDDGRRWLRRNPTARFDAIIQNTSYYWRANIGNLLSREYFSEVARHLNPGGIMIANTTGSFDVLATVGAVFPHTYRYANFVYASDRPLVPDVAVLSQVHRPDGALFSLDNAPAGSVVALLQQAHLEEVQHFVDRHNAHAEVITDDNLLSEYRHGRRFGPRLLRALTPPETPEFALNEP